MSEIYRDHANKQDYKEKLGAIPSGSEATARNIFSITVPEYAEALEKWFREQPEVFAFRQSKHGITRNRETGDITVVCEVETPPKGWSKKPTLTEFKKIFTKSELFDMNNVS